MALREQLADLVEVAALECLDGRLDPAVLANDVLAEAPGLVVELAAGPGPVEGLEVDVAQCAHRGIAAGDDRYGSLALGAASVVLGGAEAPRRARIARDKRMTFQRQRHGAVLQRAAVEQHRCARPTARRGELG